MTLQEFTDRTGLVPTATEFETIHEIYMACGDMDKDIFCKEWLKALKCGIFGSTLALFKSKYINAREEADD